MKYAAGFFCLALLVTGCRWKENSPVGPVDLLPDSVSTPIRARFKNATDISGYELEKGRIWAARFKSDGNSYSSVLTKEKLLSTARLVSNFPDSLKPDLGGFAIQGGTFSNLLELEKGTDAADWEFKCDYLWQGDTYQLRWRYYNGKLAVELAPDWKLEYTGSSISQLPIKMQVFLAAHSAELQPTQQEEYVVKIHQDNKRLYSMYVWFVGYGTIMDLLFDEGGNVLATGPFNYAPYIVDHGNKPDKPVEDTSLNTLPDVMLKKLMARPGMNGFEKSKGNLFGTWKSIYTGITSYSAGFTKGNENFLYRLDDAGNIIDMNYSGYYP